VKLEGRFQGYKAIVEKQFIPNKSPVIAVGFQGMNGLKYHEIPSIAFCAQMAQVKPSTQDLNPLDAAKAWPIKGVEYAREWPIPQKSLEILKDRFVLAQQVNKIDNQNTPVLGVYNIDSSGRHYIGLYDALTNKLTVNEGVVLFDIDKKANVVDEVLAHESYHCQRTQQFSVLSDQAVSQAIDERLEKLLTSNNFPLYEIIVGDKYEPVKPEVARILVELSKNLDVAPTETDLQKLGAFMADYTPQSKIFFINVLKKLRWTCEKSLVIGYEPALKVNLFSKEDLEQRIPDKVMQKIMLSQGLSREGALDKIINEKPGKLIMMGYISKMDADNARRIRHHFLNNSPDVDEAMMLKDLQNIFVMIEAAFNLGLAGNDKIKNINQYKILEDYVYCPEEINARQTGLQHKIDLINEEIKKSPESSHYKYQSALKIAQADFELNEVMKKLIHTKKEYPDNIERIEELTKQATELAKKADYTVPKMMGKNFEPYIPFSYGDSYRV
jgi:hypothetical protein